MGRDVDSIKLEKDILTLSLEKDVIDKAYETILKPEYFDEFEEIWDEYIELYTHSNSRIFAEERFVEDTSLDRHISRVIEITDRMGLQKSSNSHAQNIVDLSLIHI